MLDEPDAHLEILRQREIYQTITEVANQSGSQVIIASHSEIIFKEAVNRDTAVAFIGKPHKIDKKRKSEILNALIQIEYSKYLQAETTGWVLFLEGSTDLSCLLKFAEKLGHPVRR